MSLNFGSLKLEHIGQGGTADDVPLIEQAEHALYEAVLQCDDLSGDGRASVTISILLKRGEDGTIVISGKVVTKMPTKRVKGLSAFVTEAGEVLSASHKQQSLPHTEESVRPLRVAEG